MLRRSIVAACAALALAVGTAVVVATLPAGAATTLLSQGKPATASSTENAGTPASAAFDGDPGTRWSSAFSDPQWIQVDRGANATVSQVVLTWEAAYATAFQVQTSTDAGVWTTIYSTTTGTGGTQTLQVNGSGRYVRLYGTARATGYGYSLWEFQVFGSVAASCGTTNAALNRPASASSTENAGTPASAAFDGDAGTRWASAWADPQWLQVDLGASSSVCQVVLTWEAAYASAFQLQVSADAVTWTTVYSTTTGTGGTQTLQVNGSGRYVRMYGTARATGYGYSLWEFEVHGTVDTTTVTPPMLSGPTRPPATTGQFALSAPAEGAMVTNTRRPALSWAAVAGAVRYQGWVNISRTDYDFTASGSLLDLYTNVAEPTGTSYTPTWDLPGRGTYKRVVVSVNAS